MHFSMVKPSSSNFRMISANMFKVATFLGLLRFIYRNDPKFSDRYVWANSADPDHTAPGGAV